MDLRFEQLDQDLEIQHIHLVLILYEFHLKVPGYKKKILLYIKYIILLFVIIHYQAGPIFLFPFVIFINIYLSIFERETIIN